MDYFQCKPGCGKCCPDGSTSVLSVPLTLDDIRRLYNFTGLAPESFVDSLVRWKLDNPDEDNLMYNEWIPILPNPCPYKNEERKCDLYGKDAWPVVCSAAPEIVFLYHQRSYPFRWACLEGKSLSPERREKIKGLDDQRIDLEIETAGYLRDIEVDPIIPDRVLPLIGKIPLITLLNVMLKTIPYPDFQKTAQQAKRGLDQMIIDFLKEQEATSVLAAQQSTHSHQS